MCACVCIQVYIPGTIIASVCVYMYVCICVYGTCIASVWCIIYVCKCVLVYMCRRGLWKRVVKMYSLIVALLCIVMLFQTELCGRFKI